MCGIDTDIGEISNLQVMRSAAGFYVGQSYLNRQSGYWEPWSRESEYFETHGDAQAYLNFINPE
jgi:hypothetical protein